MIVFLLIHFDWLIYWVITIQFVKIIVIYDFGFVRFVKDIMEHGLKLESYGIYFSDC